MGISDERSRTARWVTALLLIPALGVFAACSSSTKSGSAAKSSGTTAAGGLPASIELPAIQNLTGPAGFAGLGTQQGNRIAVEEINSTRFLGSTTLSLKYLDAQTQPQVAAQLAASVVKSDAPLALGPVYTPVSAAVAPIVQRGGLPTIFTQSTGAGVNTGDETYIATAPWPQFINQTLGAYLKTKGIASIAFLNSSDNSAGVQTAQALREYCQQNGIEPVSSGEVTSTTTDFTAVATKIVAAKPAAVFVLLVGAQNVSAIKQLLADGYAGLIVGTDSFAGGVLTPLGSSANGILYTSDYTAALPGTVNETFTSLFAKQYGGGQPSHFAAEGYNAVWLAARALKAANSTERSKVLAALARVATTGFEGAGGTITFKDRVEQVPGVLVQWQNGKEILVKAS